MEPSGYSKGGKDEDVKGDIGDIIGQMPEVTKKT